MRSAKGEAGFSLIELMIASALTMVVVGVAASVAADVQRAFAYELDDAVAVQGGRLAIDWMTRTLSMAGSNPYGIRTLLCAGGGMRFVPVQPDPNGDGVHDDIRVHADVNPPNGLLVGLPGACDESGEDMTMAYDRTGRTITVRDGASGGAPPAITDGVVAGLTFTCLDAGRHETAHAPSIVFVRIDLTTQSFAINPRTGQGSVFRHVAEVRVRRP